MRPPADGPEVISVGIATVDYLAMVCQGASTERFGREFIVRYGVEGGGLAATAGVACRWLG